MAACVGDEVCPPTDQRSFGRNDSQCDVGAFELGAVENAPTLTEVSFAESTSMETVRSQSTFAATVTVTGDFESTLPWCTNRRKAAKSAGWRKPPEFASI